MATAMSREFQSRTIAAVETIRLPVRKSLLSYVPAIS
jgi:hypothetical protein